MPHVLANVVANQIGATRVEGHDPLANAGGSLRDMTRIAGANPRIWVDIFLDNAEQIRGELQRLRVHVPDRPGVLAGITQALGAERINIEDFELHHVSPERGGTLTVLVQGAGEARRAADMLESQGYSVVVSPVVDE